MEEDGETAGQGAGGGGGQRDWRVGGGGGGGWGDWRVGAGVEEDGETGG